MAIAEIIKFEGPRDALVWKNAGKEYLINGNEKFNALSQLIVDEFYEAILFANGMALDLFKAGRYTLTTQNIPLLTKQYEKLFDGSPFPCKVYFINKVHQLELKWGTQGGITLNDPIYDIFLHVGCCGTMAVRIDDSRKFLLKFVGNKDVFRNEDLLHNLRGIISSNVKNYISKLMIQGNVSFFDMNAHLYEVGEIVEKVLQNVFMGYGISIESFNIESIDVPRDEYEIVSKAKSVSTSRKIQGFTWQQEQMYKILDDAAKNEGTSSNFVNAGMGVGMGVGMAGPFGQAFGRAANNVFAGNQIDIPNNNVANNFFNNQTSQTQNNQTLNQASQTLPVSQDSSKQVEKRFCPNCGNEVPDGALFCMKCGTKLAEEHCCPNCGAKLDSEALFCMKCGTKVK